MLTISGLCWLCLSPLAMEHWGICSYCQRALFVEHPCCPRCGLPAMGGNLPCGRCQLQAPPWHHIVSISDYQPPLSTLVQRLKFQNATALALALSRLIVLKIREQRYRLPRADLLLSVPLHHRRAWHRGFNQSDLLARRVSKWLNIYYAPQALVRNRATRVQHKLGAKARKRNMANAFSLEMPVAGRHIAIIDDVVTTGGTAGEIARLLIRHGAATIQIWCLCRTL